MPSAEASSEISGTSPPRSALSIFTGVCVITLVVAVVYGSSLGFDFVIWDDPVNVTQNPYLDPLTPTSLVRFWTRPYQGLYIPLTYTLWAGDTWLSRVGQDFDGRVRFDPRVFHATNLLLFIACSLAIFWMLLELGFRPLPAILGTLLFAVHPTMVESVAWVTEAKGLLCTALGWLAVALYLRARRQMPPQPGTGSTPGSGWATVAFVGALLAKPAAVVVPLWIISLERFWFGASWRDAVRRVGDWLVMSIAWVLITRWVQPATGHSVDVALWQRPFVAGDAVAFYLGKLVWPADLAPDYGRTPEVAFASPWIYIAWLIPVLLIGWAWRTNSPPLRLALAWFFAGLLPVLGLITFHFQAISTVADRYLLIAMTAPALLACWFLSRAGRWASAVAGMILVALAVRSHAQVEHWRDSDALVSYMLEQNPRSFAAHNNMGVLAMQRKDWETAKEHLLKAADLAPDVAQPHVGLGDLFMLQEDLSSAESEYRLAVDSDPQNAAAHASLGHVLAKQKNFAAAIEQYRASLALDRNQPGVVNVLARIRAAQVDPQFRDAKEAVELAELGRDLSSGRTPRPWETLAAAYAEAGRFDDAIASLERCIRVAQEQGYDKFALAANEQIKQYQRGEPLREELPPGLP